MRTANLTGSEILEAEKAADQRRQQRMSGFGLMNDRDEGQHTLSNGVTMVWHIPKPPKDSLPDLYVYPLGCSISPDEVMIDGKYYNVEELKKWLRWA